MKNWHHIISIIALILFAQPGQAVAQATTSLADIAQIEMLPGWRTKAGTRMAAIRINLADGWKTYWRAPGEAGIPPSFDWSGSANLADVEIHWPTPAVFSANGLYSIGYKHSIVIPVELRPAHTGPIALRAKMAIGVCNDICVPISATLAADLSGTGQDDPQIRASLARQPVPADKAGVHRALCELEPTKDGLALTARIELARLGPQESVAIELAEPGIWVAQPESRRSAGILTARTELVPPSGAPFALSRSDIRITVLADGKAVDIQGCTGS